IDAPLPLLLGCVIVGSLTNPLGAAGSRSLFPMLVPRHLWDRANAVDSISYMATTMIGPPLAGAIIALTSPDIAIAVTAVLFLVAAVTQAGVRDVSPAVVTGRLVDDAREGVLYVLRHPTLRSLGASMSLNAAGHGILIVALPVLVLRNGYGGPSTI